jgi:hypothetical protein
MGGAIDLDRTTRRKVLHDLADRLQSDARSYEGKFTFPVEDVVSCLRDDKLQVRHSLAAAKDRYKAGIAEPIENAIWFYFASPALTWETLCGRAGWMVVAKEPLREVAFFLEIMS